MPAINEEIIQKLSAVQNQIWQSVTISASEAARHSLTFGTPLTVATTINDLFAEMAAPKLIIQFAFADLPQNTHVLLLTQETFAEIVGVATGTDTTEIAEIDDNLISDARPILESIVQGLCLGVGNVLGEPITATGLTIRFQIFNFPASLQRAEQVVRTNVAISSDQINGTLTWLHDDETALVISGMRSEENQAQNGGEKSNVESANIPDETHSLEILMDIPLEISVELGRIRMKVKDVVELGSGSIIELNKSAGEPVDILVNGRLVAHGEVVVIEDNFGVRITEILSPQERMQRLSEVA